MKALEIIEAQTRLVEELNRERAPKGSLEFLGSIYRDVELPLSQRMRAAIAALPFENPKLAVTANINAQNFAAEIEAAMIRSGKPLTIDGAKPIIPARR
jgi:hypothetical protein